MMRLIILFILLLSFAFSETGYQMKSPTTGAFDFTYENNLSNSIQSFNPEKSLDKILVQISKQDTISRRENQIFSCMNDTYGTIYCPAALAPANKYSTYKESTVIEKSSTVVDYTNKTTVTECTTNGDMYSNCGGQKTLSGATQYCANLVEGGYSDWRLPTISETTAKVSGGIPSCGGSGTWTSSTSTQYSPFTSLIWDGTTTLYTQPSNATINVRCAR